MVGDQLVGQIQMEVYQIEDKALLEMEVGDKIILEMEVPTL